MENEKNEIEFHLRNLLFIDVERAYVRSHNFSIYMCNQQLAYILKAAASVIFLKKVV
jgi:hypothetical protein